MALCPGLSSVSIVLQHRQWAALLISGHWRCLSTAGERPECNGLSLHSFSMVSCQRVREKYSGERAAKIQQKCFQNVYLHSCRLISWIIFGKPEESVKKNKQVGIQTKPFRLMSFILAELIHFISLDIWKFIHCKSVRTKYPAVCITELRIAFFLFIVIRVDCLSVQSIFL